MLLIDQVKHIKSDALKRKRDELQEQCNSIYGSPESLKLLKAIEIIDDELRARITK